MVRQFLSCLLYALAGLPLMATVSGCYFAFGSDGVVVGTVLDIQQQPQSQTVLVGQSASFAIGVVAVGPIRGQWRRNGVDIVGATSFTYTTPPTTLADNGSLFTVLVCNDSVCVTSSPALLSVMPR